MNVRRKAASLALVFFLAAPWARSQSAEVALKLPDAPQAQQNSSTPSTSAKNPPSSKPTTAEEQLKQQEKQRILGVMAAFNTTQNHNALPLSPRQKFQLFFKSVTDPWPFGLTAVVAAIGQAEDSDAEYGQGMEGYAKRYGASYADYFTGNFFGNAVLPSLLHEDPRYFQKGTGSIVSRALWAAASTGWCKRDDGSWGPNYANVGGNLIGAAISNTYYPASDHTVGDTIQRGLTVTVEGAIGAELIEFWPDIERHYKRRKSEKLARKAAERDAQETPQPAAPAPATPASSNQPN